MPSPRPTPENLAAELAAMLRTGITIDGCRQSPAILSLALVRAKASSNDANDLAVAANHLIREACASVDSLSEGPTAVLLAVAQSVCRVHGVELVGHRLEQGFFALVTQVAW